MNIRKGDTVKILAGRDRGKTGKVLGTAAKEHRATVEGLNILFRHKRPKRSGEKGQKIQFPKSLHFSNLALICPHCGKPTRIGHMTDDKGIKTRMCKKCGKRI
ncbi:MAG: 50S ribosomal protein L24 [bacterium]|nr:50S ribosomal protein L24 [bacterium]